MTAVYDTRVTHVRRSPVQHAFTYRSRSWLVDVDRLPRKGFRSRDHVGSPALSLRQNVDVLLAAHGLHCSRVLLLASPRRLGHVFNPLSVFWCLDPAGEVVATVAEVHNTYGGRHAYVLPAGVSEVEKSFYVSPFHQVEGRYELRLPLPGERVHLDVTYHRTGAEPFVASVRGVLDRPRPRDLFAGRLVAARIRIQGVRLLLRALPVVPRPSLEPVETP